MLPGSDGIEGNVDREGVVVGRLSTGEICDVCGWVLSSVFALYSGEKKGASCFGSDYYNELLCTATTKGRDL